MAAQKPSDNRKTQRTQDSEYDLVKWNAQDFNEDAAILEDHAALIDVNSAKTGITSEQAAAIVVNTAKVSLEDGSVTNAKLNAEVENRIAANDGKVGITTAQSNAIVANTNKVSLEDGSVTNAKLNAEVENRIAANDNKVSMSVLDEDDFSSDSDTLPPSQQSVKANIDALKSKSAAISAGTSVDFANGPVVVMTLTADVEIATILNLGAGAPGVIVGRGGYDITFATSLVPANQVGTITRKGDDDLQVIKVLNISTTATPDYAIESYYVAEAAETPPASIVRLTDSFAGTTINAAKWGTLVNPGAPTAPLIEQDDGLKGSSDGTDTSATMIDYLPALITVADETEQVIQLELGAMTGANARDGFNTYLWVDANNYVLFGFDTSTASPAHRFRVFSRVAGVNSSFSYGTVTGVGNKFKIVRSAANEYTFWYDSIASPTGWTEMEALAKTIDIGGPAEIRLNFKNINTYVFTSKLARIDVASEDYSTPYPV